MKSHILFGSPVMITQIDKKSYDKKSIISTIEKNFKLNNGDINLKCFDWSTELANKNKWRDALEVSIHSKEFVNWLKNLY